MLLFHSIIKEDESRGSVSSRAAPRGCRRDFLLLCLLLLLLLLRRRRRESKYPFDTFATKIPSSTEEAATGK